VFEQAAREAEARQDSRRSDLWVQSGNSWLAADDGAKARKAFDAALATGQLTPELRGEVHLDRARAGVAIADLPGARADIDKGLALVPADPMAWYLSAALALREGNMVRANADIAKAVQLAPDDANVLLQAGTIVGTNGDIAAAKAYYARAAKAGPNSEAGRAAKAALVADASTPVTEAAQ
jgi:Tfp pilus assembly protein PilF